VFKVKIYNPRTSNDLWKLYAVIAGLSVFALCFLMPPFQVNDEFQHFFRSYQVSRGIGIGRVHGQVAGGYLPASLPALVIDFLGSLNLYMVHPVVAEPMAHTFSFLSVPLDSSKKVFVDFSGAAVYAPTGYLPQAFGILVARSLGAGALGCFFACRLANGIVAVVATSCALRITPFGRYAFFVIGLMPTVLYVDASVSQDADMIVAMLLFIALCLRAYERKQWSFDDAAVATVMGITFSIAKFAYIPILALALAPCFAYDASHTRRARVMIPASIIAIGIICSIIWLVISHPLMVWHGNGHNAMRQLVFVLENPGRFAAAVIWSIAGDGIFYLRSATSMFVGWPPEIALPKESFLLILLSFLALPLACGDSGPHLDQRSRLLVLSIVPICIFSPFLLIYISFDPVGLFWMGGVQGRYFIPSLLLFALFLTTIKIDNMRPETVGASRIVIVTISILNSMVLIATICQRYQLILT
jgi:uncharacterized membrane protein